MGRTSRRRIQLVRRFNRFHTRWLGIFGRNVFGSSFSLAEGRIIFEIASREPCYATDLARHLKLDAGHLSRVLDRLARRGLVARRPCAKDGRRRLLALTDAGVAALAHINGAADKRTSDVLRDLGREDQDRLVEAMVTIQDLLESGGSTNEPLRLRGHQPGDMGWVVRSHGLTYHEEFGWDETFEVLVAEIVAGFVRDFDPSREKAWFVEQGGDPVASVFLSDERSSKQDTAQLRLLYVDPRVRGRGVGTHLVRECTRFAREVGYERIVLWTSAHLEPARRLYAAEGYELMSSEPTHSFGHDWTSERWMLTL